MSRTRILAACCLLLLIVAPLLLSQTPAAPPVPDHWWKMSSFTAVDSLNRTLFHGEGQLSYQNTTGNFESRMIASSAEFDLRKGAVTGALNYQYSNQQAKDNNQETSREYLLASLTISWDILPFLIGNVGVLWEKDEQRMMKNRYLPYAGIGTRWTITPAHQLNFFVAGGRAFPTYTIPIRYFGLDEGPFYGVHLSQYYKFTYARGQSFEEEIVHLRNLHETNRYSTTLTLRIAFALASYLELFVGYTRAYNSEAAFIKAKEIDAGQTVGLRFSM